MLEQKMKFPKEYKAIKGNERSLRYLCLHGSALGLFRPLSVVLG